MDNHKKLTKIAVETAVKAGASYADVRIVSRRMEMLEYDNAAVSVFDNSESVGFGVRVLANGAWGFDCSNIMTESEVKKVSRSGY